MSNWSRDIRYALRMLANNKGFTAVAILALALGIGPNVAIFSIIWATFLAPLPYPHANQLVVVWTKFKGERGPTRADDYAQYAAQSKSFERLDFSSWAAIYLTNPDHSQDQAHGLPATPGTYTKTLGMQMALGRDFLPEEGVPGNNHFVILTHKLWQDRYHSDPNIIGQPILIADEPYIVVGVIEAGVADRIPQQFVAPLTITPGFHDSHWGGVMGRLKPGVTIAQAQAELAVIDRRLAATRGVNAPKDLWTVSVEPLKNDWLDKKLERNLWLLLAAVGFVLLIACANVANLLLARGSSRQQELAVRAALGATPRQVFGQLLIESLTLAILGGTIGIAMGWAIMKLSMAILPDLAKQTAEAVVQLNLPVLCFATGATLLSGIVFGCVPAWQAARVNLSETLKQGSRSTTGQGRMRTQGALVTAEVALALTLLAGAGMVLHSFWNLSRIDLGIRPDHVLSARLQPQTTSRQGQAAVFPPPEQISANARQLLDNVHSIPGIEEATLATTMPLQGHDSFPFNVAGHAVADADRPVADLEVVTPGFFRTFDIRLAGGRFIDDGDNSASPQVVMVNESFVRRFLPGVDPLGQRLLLQPIVPNQKPGPATERQIVGVYHDIVNGEHLTDKAFPAMYVPFFQNPWPYTSIAVRTAVDPASLTSNLRRSIAQVAPTLTMTDVQTTQDEVRSQLTGDRFGMVLFGGFAAVALLLAALGIYGLMAFAVAQRRHEIGLRMALGAQRHQVVRLILANGMKLALIGVGIGLVGVYLLGRLLRSTLYGIGTVDLASFSAVACLLLAAAVIASYVPARRSAKVDPMIALRQE
jgi:putative ABC transport system permease protein